VSVLNHLAQAAAILLIGELLVVLIIFLAIAGGLAFGLRWVRGKTGWAMTRADTGLKTAQTYVDKGTTMAAKPMIVAHGWFATAEGTLLALQSEARRIRGAGVRPAMTAPLPSEPPASGGAARPVTDTASPATDETTAIPQLVATQTQPVASEPVPANEESR